MTDPGAIADAGRHFQAFLDDGAHGDMDWLAARPERRIDPRVLWPGVRSVIMLGVNYGPDENPLAILEQRSRGAISVYAQGDDYHDLIKKRLKALARWLVAASGARGQGVRRHRRGDGKAAGAGRGTGLAGQAHQPRVARIRLLAVSRRDLHHPGSAARQRRGRPLRLMSGLPRYLPDRGVSGAVQARCRRCISYLTIESKSPIPREFRKAIGNRIYGCDDCLAVCPWNKFAQAGREAKLAARENLRAPDLADLARLDDAAFRALFTKSPVKRIGRDRFIRNVLIAIGNSDEHDLAVEAERLLDDPSPLVRGAAVWALVPIDRAEGIRGPRIGGGPRRDRRNRPRRMAGGRRAKCVAHP